MLVFGNKSLIAMKMGPTSQLQPIESEIIKFIFEHHKQGFPVSHRSVVMYASKFLPEYGVKTPIARCSAMKRFLLAHEYVHRLDTHVSQKSPSLMTANAKDFVSIMHPFLHGPTRDPCYILNMDQTPVFFSMHDTYTLNERGACTVNICTSKNDSARITVAIMITASGHSLRPMVIFKGAVQL